MKLLLCLALLVVVAVAIGIVILIVYHLGMLDPLLRAALLCACPGAHPDRPRIGHQLASKLAEARRMPARSASDDPVCRVLWTARSG